jgi:hypothetical protein
MTSNLFGLPTDLTIADTPLAPEALAFSNWDGARRSAGFRPSEIERLHALRG